MIYEDTANCFIKRSAVAVSVLIRAVSAFFRVSQLQFQLQFVFAQICSSFA